MALLWGKQCLRWSLMPYTDPVRVSRMLTRKRGNRALLPFWGVAALGIMGATLFTIAARGVWWGWMLGGGVLAWSLVMISSGVAMVMTTHVRFWLAYTLAPGSLLVYFLVGLLFTVPYGLFGVACLFGLVVGVHLSVMGAIWTHRNYRWYRLTPAPGDPGAAHPPFTRWGRRVQGVRISIVLGALALAFVLPLGSGAGERPLAVAVFLCLGMVGIGVLRLEATLALWTGTPLVRLRTARRVHLTSAGRFALWVPPVATRHLLDPQRPVRIRAASLLCLLRYGTAGYTLTSALRPYPPAAWNELLLAFSLLDGGHTTLRYLETVLPPALHPLAQAYLRLMETGALPVPVQPWYETLATVIPPLQEHAPELSELLANVWAGLYEIRDPDTIRHGEMQLRQWVARQMPLSEQDCVRTWSGMLLRQLAQRRVLMERLSMPLAPSSPTDSAGREYNYA